MQLTHLSLFTGIGGLDLAAEWAGFTTVGQCEFADYPTKVLERHWPNVPRWRDIRTLTGESFYERTGLRTVDVISGGFPCQPFSVAGKQKGKEDDRYLWPEMLRVIRELAPRWVIGENVPGIMRIAAADVVKDLEREGYDVVVFDFEAAAVGAPHRRERIAFVGNAKHNGSPPTAVSGCTLQAGKWFEKGADSPGESAGAGGRNHNAVMGNAHGKWEQQSRREQREGGGWSGDASEVVANANSGTMRDDRNDNRQADREINIPDDAGIHRGEAVSNNDSERCKEQHFSAERVESERRINKIPNGNSTSERFSDWVNISLERSEQIAQLERSDWWAVEPDVGRMAHGIPHRVDRLRCLGNADVPKQFYPIFRAIWEVEHDGRRAHDGKAEA